MSQGSEGSTVGSPRVDRGGDMFLNVVGGLFVLAVTLPSVLLLYSGAPIGLAILALPASLICLIIFIGASGTDLMDVTVNSVIFLVLTGIAAPSILHGRQRAADEKIATMQRRLDEKQADIDEAKWRREAHARWLKSHPTKR